MVHDQAFCQECQNHYLFRLGVGSRLNRYYKDILYSVLVSCELEVDSVYGLLWGSTAAGVEVVQPCGREFIGNASRVCDSKGNWTAPNVTGCMGRAILEAAEVS